jgi:hypothetical protein
LGKAPNGAKPLTKQCPNILDKLARAIKRNEEFKVEHSPAASEEKQGCKSPSKPPSHDSSKALKASKKKDDKPFKEPSS